MKFRPVGASCSMRTDVGKTERRTDMTKLIVALRISANAPKDGQYFCLYQLTETSVFQVTKLNKKLTAEKEPVVKRRLLRSPG